MRTVGRECRGWGGRWGEGGQFCEGIRELAAEESGSLSPHNDNRVSVQLSAGEAPVGPDLTHLPLLPERPRVPKAPTVSGLR